MTHKKLFCTASLLVTLVFPRLSFAGGYTIYGLSSNGQAQGESVTASVNDSSAAWYNPARLIYTDKTDFSIYVNNKYLFAEYTDSSGKDEDSKDSHFLIPSIYTSYKTMGNDAAFALAVNSPFGLSTSYSEKSSFRYMTTGGEVKIINVAPTVAYKLSDSLSAGVGLNIYNADVTLSSRYPWAAIEAASGLTPSSNDGKYQIRGSGTGYGFNTGLNANLLDNHSIGIVYRSQVVIGLDGKEASLNGIPTAFQSSFSNASAYTTNVKTSLRLPDSFVAAYAFKPSKSFTVELDYTYWDWSDFKSINIDLENEAPGLLTDSDTDVSWKDSWDIGLGMIYSISEYVSLRSGYKFSKTPTNKSTYTPLVPDSDYHVFSFGIGYKSERVKLELPFAFATTFGKRNIDSDTTDAFGIGQSTDGKYGFIDVEFGFKVGYLF